MLQLRQVAHLTRTLGTTPDQLAAILSDTDSYYEELELFDPAKPDRVRRVVNVTGLVRHFQSRLYQKVLLPKLMPSEFSHGGVRGRHIKTNVAPHLRSRYVLKTDISNFYPSIHHSRIYRLFVGRLRCSPDVARLCARLCSYRHHLALGLITSPILADQIMRRVDGRIGAACETAGLAYTRFVDDITISGHFDFSDSGFPGILKAILEESGFRQSLSKTRAGSIETETITGLRVVDRRIDVRREYVEELERQIQDALALAAGKYFEGPYYTESQIRGRLHFVKWISPGRSARLMRLFKSVPWDKAAANARGKGLVVAKKTLRPIPRQSSAIN